MLDKLKAVEDRFEELCFKAEQPDFYNDPKQAAKLLRERSDLEPIVEAYRAYGAAAREMEEAEELMADPEMKELCQEAYAAARAAKDELYEKLQILLLPKDPNDEKSVIVEIRGGVGGEESALFAHSLFRMYSMYAARQGWSIELLNYNETELGGVKEADFIVNGRGAYSRLKYESGVHRVQRVPETETQGRIQTSAASVAVFPEAGEFDVDLSWDDIRLDLFCSSGPGGQGVNTTYSAVRLTHIPSGLVVQCQEERSQLKNKDRAFEELRTRLYNLEHQKYLDGIAAKRKTMVSTGDRSAKIRTYNYPQGRVTDHRINWSMYNLPAFMDGDIQDCIDQLQIAENAERLKEAGE